MCRAMRPRGVASAYIAKNLAQCMPGAGRRVEGLGCRISGFGCRVYGVGLRG